MYLYILASSFVHYMRRRCFIGFVFRFLTSMLPHTRGCLSSEWIILLRLSIVHPQSFSSFAGTSSLLSACDISPSSDSSTISSNSISVGIYCNLDSSLLENYDTIFNSTYKVAYIHSQQATVHLISPHAPTSPSSPSDFAIYRRSV